MESTEGPPVLCRLPLLETKPSLGRRILSGAGQRALVLPELAVCGENRCAFPRGPLTVAPGGRTGQTACT